MTTQDLTNNRERIIRKIRSQITMATNEQVKDVMVKMVAMLPQFASDKATMANIDKLTLKAAHSYIKRGLVFNAAQGAAIDNKIAIKQAASLPSSMQR